MRKQQPTTTIVAGMDAQQFRWLINPELYLVTTELYLED